MPKYVAPLAKRKTFSDAIASAVPVYLQTQQQIQQQEMMSQRMAMQQEQFERSLAERTADRLAAAERANQANAYKAQKELEKTYKERVSDIHGFDTSNLNEAQIAVINLLVKDGMDHLNAAEPEWQESLNKVEQYLDLFTSTEEDLEKRESDFSEYVYGKEFGDPTMEFIADESVLNNYRSIRSMGGIDVESLDLVDGVPVARWLGPDGKPLKKDGMILSGPISDAPYYDPSNRAALYSIDGNLVERANMSPADFLIEFDEEISLINGDPTLTSQQRKDKLKELLLNGFEDKEALSDTFKVGLSSAIKSYDRTRLNKDKPMVETEVLEAVNQYVDKIVNLYQPERSILETELDYNNYFEQRLSKIANEINRRDDLTRDQKVGLFVERSNNVFKTGTDDLDKRARATAEDAWKANNTGAAYNEADAYKQYMANVLERADVLFEEQREESPLTSRAPSQAERKVNRNKTAMLSAISEESPQADFPSMEAAPTMQSLGFNTENVTGSSIALTDFKNPIKIANYLPDSFSTGREETVPTTDAAGNITGFERVAGPRLDVEARPTQMRILNTDKGIIIELGGWTSVKNARDPKVQIPPIYIDPNIAKGGVLMQSLNDGLQDSYGTTMTELLETFIKNTGGL